MKVDKITIDKINAVYDDDFRIALRSILHEMESLTRENATLRKLLKDYTDDKGKE